MGAGVGWGGSVLKMNPFQTQDSNAYSGCWNKDFFRCQPWGDTNDVNMGAWAKSKLHWDTYIAFGNVDHLRASVQENYYHETQNLSSLWEHNVTEFLSPPSTVPGWRGHCHVKQTYHISLVLSPFIQEEVCSDSVRRPVRSYNGLLLRNI